MSRCLSDAAMTRVLAELATSKERAHLETCAACAARYRGLTRDVDVIRQVLVATAEPPIRAVRDARRWVPAVAALSAVAVAALLWIEVAAWRGFQSAPPPADQIALALADVSAALFSVSGEPARLLLESPVPGGPLDDETAACEGPEGLAAERCAGALEALDEPALMDSDILDNGNSPEQGEAS